MRTWEAATRKRIEGGYWVTVHGWCIGLLVLGSMWAVAAVQRWAGVHSLALRYLVTLGIGYLVFLGLLRLWGGMMARHERLDPADGLDLLDGPSGGDLGHPSMPRLPSLRSGQGGDFAGGGADGSFGSSLASDAADAGATALGEAASGVVDAAASSDEGAVVIVPVLVVFVAGCAVLLGAGSLLLLFFGSEALLAVAVEVAFGYVSARTAVRVARAGWLQTAVALTWKPLAGALVCAGVLGGLIDHFVPGANSLPEAVRMVRVR